MSGKKCSKKITINGQKILLKDVVVYAFDGERLRRIRHKDQLPVDGLGAGINVAVAPKHTEVSSDDILQLESALRAGKSESPLENWSVAVSHSPRKNTTGKSEKRLILGEGGLGFASPTAEELYVLAANFRSNDTFYESVDARAQRMRELVQALVKEDPLVLPELVEQLCSKSKSRTAALTIAVDAAVAGHKNANDLIMLALKRPDDPGLVLQYAKDTYGRLPRSVRKAAAAAAVLHYTETAVLRFDKKRTQSVNGESTTSGGFTFADVLASTHPTPSSKAQAALFAHLSGQPADTTLLPTISTMSELRSGTNEERQQALSKAAKFATAVFTNNDKPPMDRVTKTLLSCDWRALSSIAPINEKRSELKEKSAALSVEIEQLYSESKKEYNHARYLTKKISRIKYLEQTKKLSEADTLGLLKSLHADEAQFYASSERSKQKAESLKKDRDLIDNQAKHAVSREQVEVALVNMSYKDTLMNLTTTLDAQVSKAAMDYVKERIANPSDSDYNTTLSDLIRATKAVSEYTIATTEKSVEYKDDYYGWGRPSWVTTTTDFDDALGKAAQSVVGENLQSLSGKKVLVMVDGSGSMFAEVSTRHGDLRSQVYSGLRRDEVASFVAGAIVAGAPEATVDTYAYDTSATLVEVSENTDTIEVARTISAATRGGGTDTWAATLNSWNEHDVVVILTDEQTSWSFDENRGPGGGYYGYGYWDSEEPKISTLPAHVQVVTCNLAGDDGAHVRPSDRTHRVAGMTDELFEVIGAAASLI